MNLDSNYARAGDLVEVLWLDTASYKAWEREEDIFDAAINGESFLVPVKTAGYLIHIDEEQVLLADGHREDSGEVTGKTAIPFGCVQEITKYAKSDGTSVFEAGTAVPKSIPTLGKRQSGEDESGSELYSTGGSRGY